MKYALSFLKRQWSLSDYPILVRFTEPQGPPFAGPVWKPVGWSAHIEAWLLSGSGGSRQEALDDLRCKFEDYKREHKTLPRPGSNVPLQFASTERLSRLGPVAQEFLRRILDLDAETCFISDESSLYDFTFGHPVEPVIARIEAEYGITVSDVKGANIVTILERIAVRLTG